MAINRADLRLAIREILKEFFDNDTIAVGGITSSATTLPVTTIARYKIGDVLQVESELMKVEGLDSTVTPATLTVQRGFRGSTAAAHIAAVAIRITPEVTDRMLNYAINTAIADTYSNPDRGDMGIWYEVVDTTLTTSSSTREYTLPSGLATTHFIVEIRDGSGNYQITRDYRVSGTKLVFGGDLIAGYTIRISGMAYQAQLSDDTTTLTLSDEQSEFIKYSGALAILEMRLGPRIKATEYSAAVNDRAGQPNDMVLVIGHFRNKQDLIKRRESKPMKSHYSARPKR